MGIGPVVTVRFVIRARFIFNSIAVLVGLDSHVPTGSVLATSDLFSVLFMDLEIF